MVAQVKKTIQVKRVGHGGTLDPAATGVLPVVVGKATRMSEYLHLYPKTYKAEIELGITTDTYDREGAVISRTDASPVSKQRVEELLNTFRGIIVQKVPPYSAAKFQGQPLYSLAREGASIALRQKQVEIHDIGLLSWQWPVFAIKVVCGKGTYIRSLAHDIGQALGCGAILSSLERESYGPFTLADSISPEKLADINSSKQVEEALYPLDFLFGGLSRVILNGEQQAALDAGKGAELESTLFENQLNGYLPVYSTEEQFLGVIQEVTGLWRWHKVFK